MNKITKFIRNGVIAIAAAALFVAMLPKAVPAMTLDNNTIVYLTSARDHYHLRPDCGNNGRTTAHVLANIIGQYTMCPTCAKELGLDVAYAQGLTAGDLPLETSDHQGSSSSSENTESADNSSSENSNSGNSGNSGSSESSSENSSESSSESSSEESKSSGSSKSSDKSESSSSSESDSKQSDEESSDSEESSSKSSDSDSKTTSGNTTKSNSKNDSKSSDSNSKSNDSSKSNTTKSNTTNSNSKNSSKNTTKSSSGGSSNSGSSAGELMTEKQRRARFSSKTNPKRGTVVATTPRALSAGFTYADFGKYNSYNSENHLGGTPLYLLGTIMDIQPVKQTGSQYGLAVMVNDCDGYQWYMRCNCDQSKLPLLKAELMGKAGYIYGTYAGYSGVTNRPMLDMTMVLENGGNAVNMALYR